MANTYCCKAVPLNTQILYGVAATDFRLGDKFYSSYFMEGSKTSSFELSFDLLDFLQVSRSTFNSM